MVTHVIGHTTPTENSLLGLGQRHDSMIKLESVGQHVHQVHFGVLIGEASVPEIIGCRNSIVFEELAFGYYRIRAVPKSIHYPLSCRVYSGIF